MSADKMRDKDRGLNRSVGSLFSRQREDAPVERPTFTPTLPQVDLLPQGVRDSIAIRKIRRLTILLIALVLVAGAALWTMQTTPIEQAQAQLADVTATGAKLKAQVKALSPIQAMVSKLEAQQGLVKTALAAQPRAADVMSRLAAAGKTAGTSAIDFQSVTITYYPIPAPGGQINPCPDPDPFGNELAIGCATFNATAQTRAEVTALLNALEADPFFVGPYVSTSSVAQQAEGERVTFTGSVGITPDALRTPLTQEQITEILTPPQPSASATPSSQAAAGGQS